MALYRKFSIFFVIAWSAALSMGSCRTIPKNGLASRQTETIRRLVILYTNDEHGWMDGYQNTSGAAGMARLWKQREGLGENNNLLILSGGDMWTGPALSTVLEGESMADVMNRLGYHAAAIGNHDFDFGQDAIRDRLAQSGFPFLSANIRVKETGEIPDFAQPYLVEEVNGIKVGIIGLTTTQTSVDTKPDHVADLSFLNYRDVIPTFAEKAREDGAELLVIIAHVCAAETRTLAGIAAEHGVSIIGGGHCHQEINEVQDGVRLVESGFFMRGYIRMELLFDTQLDKVVEIDSQFISNDRSRIDSQIASLIEQWRSRTDPGLWEIIGYAASSIDRKSSQMARLLLGPWLEARPGADVALADSRYVQQDLFPGDISEATIIGMLSTTNELVEIEITGHDLIQVLESRDPLRVGVIEEDGFRLANGAEIQPESTYKVLVSESLYAGGNYFELFRLDPTPKPTGINWRDPAVEWIRSLGTSERDPLENYLDNSS